MRRSLAAAVRCASAAPRAGRVLEADRARFESRVDAGGVAEGVDHGGAVSGTLAPRCAGALQSRPMAETVSLGALALGWEVAAAAGRIASDRVGASLGRALPATPEAFADTDVVNALLRSGAPDGAAPLPPVARVGLPGVVFESSNCQNFLVELDFAGGAPQVSRSEPKASEDQQMDLPATAYVKLPCRSLTTRVFANALGFWALECTFC